MSWVERSEIHSARSTDVAPAAAEHAMQPSWIHETVRETHHHAGPAACEAEPRVSAFPGRAWERVDGNNAVGEAASGC